MVIDGAGNSQQTLNYEVKDRYPYEGASFYRLKQTDYGGQFAYSNMVRIEMDGLFGRSALTLYPNPANHQVSISGVQQPDGLKIYDLSGISVLSQITYEFNYGSLSLDVSRLAPGIYLVVLPAGSVKLVKE